MTAGDLITADFQLEWRGTLLGSGTPFGWQNLAGWLELPAARIGDQPRPFRHGAYAGQLLSDERTITWDFRVASGAVASAMDTLRTITAMEEAPDEEPLVIRLSGVSWQVMARCTRRALPVDRLYVADVPIGSIQWVATDPRLYSAGAALSQSTGLPSAGTGGLVFPLVFPLTFGTGAGGGTLALTNAGTIATWPTFLVTGPVTGPIISNPATGETLTFDPTFTVAAGQTMTIDTDARTVMVGSTNRRANLFVANWFPLRKGTTQVRFSSVGAYDPAAQLTAQWRHATI